MDANASLVTDYAENIGRGLQTRFLRIDNPFHGGWDSFYDVRQPNIDALTAFGLALAAEFKTQIGAAEGAIADRTTR